MILSDEFVLKDEYRLVRDCVSGFIFDSTPVDFTSDLGTRFVLHPTVLKMSRTPPLASWIANGIASSLDALFLSRFESQRAEYWQTLYSTVVSIRSFICFSSAFFLIFRLVVYYYFFSAEHESSIFDLVLRR